MAFRYLKIYWSFINPHLLCKSSFGSGNGCSTVIHDCKLGILVIDMLGQILVHIFVSFQSLLLHNPSLLFFFSADNIFPTYKSMCWTSSIFQFFNWQPRSFGFAGTKDKRSVSTQRVISFLLWLHTYLLMFINVEQLLFFICRRNMLIKFLEIASGLWIDARFLLCFWSRKKFWGWAYLETSCF